MKKQYLIEKWIAIKAESKGKNEMILSLNPTDRDAKIVTVLIDEIFNTFIADLRGIDEDHLTDTGKMMEEQLQIEKQKYQMLLDQIEQSYIPKEREKAAFIAGWNAIVNFMNSNKPFADLTKHFDEYMNSIIQHPEQGK